MSTRSKSTQRFLESYGYSNPDRYPAQHRPRNGQPSSGPGGGCPEEIAESNEKAFIHTVNRFMKRFLVSSLKKRGWQVDMMFDGDSRGSDFDEEGLGVVLYTKAKAGQRIRLGGRSSIVLDRTVEYPLDMVFIPEMYVEQIDDSEQFDVDDFSEGSYEVDCPNGGEISHINFERRSYNADARGVEKLLEMFDIRWLRDSNVRSKVQKRARVEPSATRVAYRHLRANPTTSALDGMTRNAVTKLVNRVIARSDLKGFFADDSWRPVHRLWGNFEKAGIPVSITKTEYQKEKAGDHYVPMRKVWRFEVNFINNRGRPTTIYGQVVAAGAGSIQDPLEKYDVTAYAS